MQAPPAGITWRLSRSRDAPTCFSLSPEEQADGARYRHPQRHRQWQDGRSIAKELLLRTYPDPARLAREDLTIRRAPAGFPEVRSSDGTTLPISLTLSHSQDRIACAWCAHEQGSVGLDVEVIEPRSSHFLEDFYDSAELALLASLAPDCRDEAITAMWCIKEAVLKARKIGLSEAARAISVTRLPPAVAEGWTAAEVISPAVPLTGVWWRREGEFALALCLCPHPGSPDG